MGVTRRADDEVARGQHFPDAVLYRGASLYYEEDRTQAEIAAQLGISRATVSRLLAEARARGVVRIEVVDPAAQALAGLERTLERVLGLDRCYLAPSVLGARVGAVLAPMVAKALEDAHLQPGDALLVSSGATMFEVSQEPLIALPGVLVAPNVGGQDELEEFYQTNEITRRLAVEAGATPVLLHAPIHPSAELYRLLRREAGIRRVLDLWRSARAALLGIGSPPRLRTSLPSVMTRSGADLRTAVGDICTRPFDDQGHPVDYPGSEELFAMGLADLRRIPHSVGVAVGEGKADAIVAAARAGYINRLVSDVETAEAVLDALGEPRVLADIEKNPA